MSIEDMEGKTFVKVEADRERDTLRFIEADGSYFEFYHCQDCCESVYIEDINGDISDLEGEVLTMAQESTKNDTDGEYGESTTWTFYNFATIKGYVNIRWIGSSNGYYSESVDLRRVENES